MDIIYDQGKLRWIGGSVQSLKYGVQSEVLINSIRNNIITELSLWGLSI